MVFAAALQPSIIARWAKFYGDRTSVSTSITYLHLAGVLLGGGFAVVADRETLRVSGASASLKERVPAIDRIHDVHRWVLGGLALTFVTGFLMLFADLRTYLPSVVFWSKMTLIALLLGNGYLRLRAERSVRKGVAAAWMISASATSRRTIRVICGARRWPASCCGSPCCSRAPC